MKKSTYNKIINTILSLIIKYGYILCSLSTKQTNFNTNKNFAFAGWSENVVPIVFKELYLLFGKRVHQPTNLVSEFVFDRFCGF